MPGLRNRLLALVGLAASLALVWLLSYWIGSQATSGWFHSDLARQSRVAVQSTREQIIASLQEENLLGLDSLARGLAEDELVIGAAICDRSGRLLATGGLYHVAQLPCDQALAAASALRPGPARIPAWITEIAGSQTLVHASVVSVADSAGPVASVVLLQNLEELTSRQRTARAVLFLILASVVVAAWFLVIAWLRRSTSEYVRGLRRALRSKAAPAEYRPLLREIRELLQQPASQDGASPASIWNSDRLRRLLRERLHGDRVIVVANREPYIHEHTADGIRLIQPASGLVTALDPVMRASSGVWIAHGAGSADREAADENGRLSVPPGNEAYRLRRIWLTEEEESGYYYGFANEGLWPLCHLVHVRPSFRASDWEHYKVVNRRFANAVSEETDRDDPVVLVHDYHFALAPRYIRELLPRSTVVAFWHIPWPNAERFGISPWRESLIEGLLGADILGFHTQTHCNNFMESVDAYMEARIDRGEGAIIRRGHKTLIRPYPISIEWPMRGLSEIPDPAECRRLVAEELELRENAIIAIGVDRLDYTKGLVERMLAAELLLERQPDLAGRFVLIQLAAPSRTRIAKYQELDAEVNATVNRINERFGHDGYRPIIMLKGHHGTARIQRFYRAADICYVSSLHDGMNLVAKEFAAARDDERGVLVLSQFAGASREFTEALIVNPYDLEKASAALNRAARMSLDEQRARMHVLRAQLAEFNVYRWAGSMLADASLLRRRVRHHEITVPPPPPAPRRRRRVRV